MGDWPRDKAVFCRLTHSGNPSISDGTTYSTLSWASALYDSTGTMFSAGSPTQISVPLAGYWHVWAEIFYNAAFTGELGIRIRQNGTTELTRQQLSTNGNVNCVICTFAVSLCALSDTLTAEVFQKSGASRAVLSTGTRFGASFIGTS